MSQLCTQLLETGQAEHKQRETELNLFYSGQRQLLSDEQEKMSDILTNFAEKHKKVSCEGRCWAIVGASLLNLERYLSISAGSVTVSLLVTLEDGRVAEIIR